MNAGLATSSGRDHSGPNTSLTAALRRTLSSRLSEASKVLSAEISYGLDSNPFVKKLETAGGALFRGHRCLT